MSYTSLILFKNGKPDQEIEYPNAWGGCARIWDALFNTYIPKRFQYDSWIVDINDTRLWDLAKREDIPVFERAVHLFTFNRFYIRRDHFGKFAMDLRAFVNKHIISGQSDHLPAWAEWFENNKDFEAVGLHGTSVSNNMWFRKAKCPHCGNEAEETEPVPLSEGTEVYDLLESLNKNK